MDSEPRGQRIAEMEGKNSKRRKRRVKGAWEDKYRVVGACRVVVIKKGAGQGIALPLVAPAVVISAVPHNGWCKTQSRF